MDLLNIPSNAGPTCENCEDSNVDSTARCFDCCTYLCQVCLDAHNQMKGNKRHKVIDV